MLHYKLDFEHALHLLESQKKSKMPLETLVGFKLQVEKILNRNTMQLMITNPYLHDKKLFS